MRLDRRMTDTALPIVVGVGGSPTELSAAGMQLGDQQAGGVPYSRSKATRMASDSGGS
jgi:hypothetical protein